MKRNEVNFSMKKILSLVLVMAMLLSAVPMTWAAEQDVGTAAAPKHYASLVLKDSIAINFKVTKAWLTENAFEKAEFLMNGEVVQTINGVPAGNTELAVFSFAKLTPAQMSEKVTVRYCFANMDPVEKTYSVLDYSKSVLEDVNENPLLKTAIVDMLSYGAAAQTYNKQTVNAELNETLTTYASLGTAEPKALTKNSALTGDEGEVKWLTVGLNLKDSVTLRFKFSTPEIEGLTLKLTSNGQTWEITKFEEAGDGNYYAYFNGLNPAQLRQVVYGEFYAYGELVSNKLAYSVESYAADNASDPEDLKALTAALMVYGDSVYTWAYTYLAGKDLTYIEAEDILLYQDVDSTLSNGRNTLSSNVVTVKEDTNASGGKVAKLDWSGAYTSGETAGETNRPAHLSFYVQPKETANYYIWVRFSASGRPTLRSWIDSNQYRNQGTTTATGWQYEIIGDTDYDSKSPEAENGYVWYLLGVGNWTAGKTYTVRLRGRTGGVSYDKFVVTTDATYAPQFGGSFASFDVDTIFEAEDTSLDLPRVTIAKDATDSNVTSVVIDKGVGATKNYLTVAGKPGDINFQVEAKTTGTHYIWAKLTDEHDSNANNLWYSFGGGEYTGVWTSVIGWAKIGTYEVTEAGEIITVSLMTRNGVSGSSGDFRNKIDKFFVTSENLAAPHEHTFGDAWGTNDTHHWHAATCGCSTVVSDKEEHDFGTTGTCECGKVQFYAAGSGVTIIEAEDVDLFTGKDSTCNGNVSHVMVVEDNAGALNKKVAMMSTGVAGSAIGMTEADGYPAHIKFKVKPSEAGTYYIWARVSMQYNSSLSVWSHIDEITHTGAYTANPGSGWRYDKWDEDDVTCATTTDFVWVRIAVCNWTNTDDMYTVRLRSRQGGKIYFDRFAVTSDAGYAPNLGDSIASFDTDTIIEAENTSLDMNRVDVTEGVVYMERYYANDNFTDFRNVTGAFGAINFQVQANTAGTYYIWAKYTNSSSIYYSINHGKYVSIKPASAGWQKIGTYTVNEAGEIISVSIVARQRNNKIDQFYVTADSSWNGTT